MLSEDELTRVREEVKGFLEEHSKKGRPYQELLNLLPGIDLESVDGSLYCCGMAGIMGFKRDFHETSIHLGNRLMAKIKALNPGKLVTDCLSCRLQFKQLLPHKVLHPIELIKEAYNNSKDSR